MVELLDIMGTQADASPDAGITAVPVRSRTHLVVLGRTLQTLMWARAVSISFDPGAT